MYACKTKQNFVFISSSAAAAAYGVVLQFYTAKFNL